MQGGVLPGEGLSITPEAVQAPAHDAIIPRLDYPFGGGVTVAQQILVLLVLVRIQAPELSANFQSNTVRFKPRLAHMDATLHRWCRQDGTYERHLHVNGMSTFGCTLA